MQGWTDIPLNERGEAQAAAAAARVSCSKDAIGAKVVYSSDLSRTMKTAEFVTSALGMQECPVADAQLREWNLGCVQGLTHLEANVQFEEVMAQLDNEDFHIPEGESHRAFQSRVVQGLTNIAKRHIGQTVIVVLHGGVLNCLRQHTLNTDKSVANSNGSINQFLLRYVREEKDTLEEEVDTDISSWQWTLEVWNDIEHLSAIGTRAVSCMQAPPPLK